MIKLVPVVKSPRHNTRDAIIGKATFSNKNEGYDYVIYDDGLNDGTKTTLTARQLVEMMASLPIEEIVIPFLKKLNPEIVYAYLNTLPWEAITHANPKVVAEAYKYQQNIIKKAKAKKAAAKEEGK